MTKAQKLAEFKKRTIVLLQHKHRYYITLEDVIPDFEYDALEREWIKLGKSLGIDMDNYPNWVGWPAKHPLAREAALLESRRKLK